MTRVIHNTRRTTYEVLGNASLQCNGALEEGELLVIYKSVDDGALWARPHTEMYDGRFTTLAPDPVNSIELPYPLRHGYEDDIAAQVDDIIAAVRPDSGATIVFTPPDNHYNTIELQLAVELVQSRGDLRARYTSVYPDY